jgi:dTDP-4-amino-4,6-dideoxygalactose transaminase
MSTGNRPAILGGTPIRAGKEWPRWPIWDERERELLGEVLESGRWSSSNGGARAEQLAAAFAAMQGARFGIPLTNGTQSLEAALAACGVGEGDEVIVPALTFVSTATAVLAVNATPVVVDVDPASLCVDVAAAEAAVSARTRAVIPVHLAGTCCDLDALSSLCHRQGLLLVEDAAHAHGSRWRGRGAGTFGAFGCFSFESHKVVTGGEGGVLLTDDAELAARARSYVDCGRVEGGHWYHHASYGTNMRMSEWQAAVLTAQLERLPEQHRVREARGAQLDRELAAQPGVRPQAGDPRMDRRGRHAYVLDYEPEAFDGLSPRGFRAALAREGIRVTSCYPPLHRLELFAESRFSPRLRKSAPAVDYAALELPEAERAFERGVWFDHSMLLADEEEVRDIVTAIDRIRSHAGAIARELDRPAWARAARTRLVALKTYLG